MISIIVPAYNEEAVIARGVRAMIDGARPGELEVIVVCNGCTDRTADAARAVTGPVQVIETPIGSKANALNLGDNAANGFPRFFVDADVLITLESVRQMAQALEQTGALAAGPAVKVDLSRASWPVRAFYEIDNRLWATGDGIGHTGVYAISEAGRARFKEFPLVTGDDAFVKRQFTDSERIGVPAAKSIVTPPATLWGLIRIKTRSHLGNYELDQRYPQLATRQGDSHGSRLAALFSNPSLWLAIGVYVFVKILARIRARWQLRLGSPQVWERDESSRIHSDVPFVQTRRASD